jgi:soluble lytic murein transglycosylase
MDDIVHSIEIKRLKSSIWTGLVLIIIVFMTAACSTDQYLSFGSTAAPALSPTTTHTPVLPTPIPSPTPLPSPTPVPAIRVSSGDQALFYGDWEQARLEFQTALAESTDHEISSAALLGIGRLKYLNGEYRAALDAFRRVIDEYPASPHVPEAYFFLGQTFDTLDRYNEAVEAYHSYINLRQGVLDAYMYERSGDAYYAMRDYENALKDYQTSLSSPRLEDIIPIQIKVARTYALLDDHATALVMYQDMYNRATSDTSKAQLDLLIGQTFTALGQLEQAYIAYSDAVENYPTAYSSYLALIELVNAGYPVSELDRGLVDYFAQQYGVALAAFDRYLASSPTDPATAHYYKGLTLSATGDYNGAIEQWEIVIQDYPQSGHWADAWEKKGYTLWASLNNYEGGYTTFATFVAEAPAHPRAAEFLFNAGRVAERAGNLDQAAEYWGRIAGEYPNAENSYRSLLLSGLCYCRLENYSSALNVFQRLLGISLGSGERSGAYFWIGKTLQKQGDNAGARHNWSQAAVVDPTGYYSERGRDLLLNRLPFTPPRMTDLGFDRAAEMAEAEAWLRTVFGISEDTSLSGPGPLLDDLRMQRGTELWHLGLYAEARQEFESLRSSVEQDPANTYRLANYTFDLGLYRSTILAARRVLTLAGMDDAATLQAPKYFNHLRFGPYFLQLVLPQAEAYDFHPLFIFSVIRQESFFEGFAASGAGARGLMQLMPATAQERANQLNWPQNYSEADLYRPLVSIRFGVDYLDFARNYLDGDLHAALAAYNGGPGNAREWKSLAGDDPDLFLEIIRFDETRTYVRSIYEVFSIYRWLYDRSP